MSKDDRKSKGRKSGSNYADRDGGKKSARDQRSSASYKSDLEKLFQGGGGGKVPERFQGMMESLKPEEGSPEAERAEALGALRGAEDFREFVKAVNDYLAKGFGLPDDQELLSRMLDHPRESVVKAVLEHLLDLHRRQTLAKSAALKARMRTLKSLYDDPRVHELADELAAVL